VKAIEAGTLNKMVADEIGICAMMLGAGRETKESSIDLSAGILLNKKVGDPINKGDVLATFYTNKDEMVIKSIEQKFRDNISITKDSVKKQKLIKAIVMKDSLQEF